MYVVFTVCVFSHVYTHSRARGNTCYIKHRENQPRGPVTGIYLRLVACSVPPSFPR